MDARQQAISKVKEVYDDGFAEINGNKYHFTKAKHRDRCKIFGYFTSIQKELEKNNFYFLGTPEWEVIEGLMFNIITFNNSLLSRLDGHFEKEDYEGDYLKLMTVAMPAISYPLYKGKK